MKHHDAIATIFCFLVPLAMVGAATIIAAGIVFIQYLFS